MTYGRFDGPILHVARITLEALSPLMIASGEADPLFDVLLARDANGLPFIPATSIAGVLRSALPLDDGMKNELLGEEMWSENKNPGRLSLTDGLALNGSLRPVDGMPRDKADADALADSIFQWLQDVQPVVRDHVRIDPTGTVDDRGKFTRAAAPKGTRFLFACEMWAAPEEARPDDAAPWQTFQAAVKDAVLAFGGATRAGYGQAHTIAVETRAFDMRKADDRDAARRSHKLSEPLGGMKLNLPGKHRTADVEITLQPEDLFRFGQGAEDDRHDADLRPVRQDVISWKNGRGRIDNNRYFIPASAIKGPLRHRTEYHLRCIKECFAGEDDEAKKAVAVDDLINRYFGTRKDGGGGNTGQLWFEDIALAAPDDTALKTIARTSIDRFTGGVRRKALYTEQALQNMPAIVLRIGCDGRSGWDRDFDKAFDAALSDLSEGWLPLGASGTKGLGAFRSNRGRESADV